MKFISTLAAASMALGAMTSVDATEHVERSLIMGGTVNPIGTKLYTAGLRKDLTSDSYCGAVLISPIHVLTSTSCSWLLYAQYAVVGTHYRNGSIDGEAIKVKTGQNHSLNNPVNGSYDFAILTLDKASTIQPVKLPKADGSDVKVGMSATALGWGFTTATGNERSYELERVSLPVWSNQDCLPHLIVDQTFFCAGGNAGQDVNDNDTGGPIVKENNKGDSDDVLIGITSWQIDYGKKGVPAAFSRVSAALPWILSITQGKGIRQ